MAENGRLNWIIRVLSESCPDGRVPEDLAWTHPGILSDHALELMADKLGRANSAPPPLPQWYEQLRSMADRVSRGEQRFRLGGGPLERLGKQAEVELTMAAAVGKASAPEIYWDLSTTYIVVGCASLRDAMLGQRIGRLVLHSRLMVIAVDALFRRLWGKAISRPRRLSDTAYVESLTCLYSSLSVYAELAAEHFAAHRDPRILADADHRLASLCDVLERNGEADALVEALKLRAILHSSSPVDQLACRTSAMGSILFATSATRTTPAEAAGLHFTYTASLGLGLRFEGSEAGLLDLPEQGVDEDESLLAQARTHLDRARQMTRTRPTGDVAGLMLHIEARQDVTETVAHSVAELAREVLDDPGPIPAMFLFLAMRLGRSTPNRCVRALREFLQTTPAAIAKAEGVRAAQWAVLEAVELAWQVAPELAGSILEAAGTIFPDYSPRRIILTRLNAEFLVRGDRKRPASATELAAARKLMRSGTSLPENAVRILLAEACLKGCRGEPSAAVDAAQNLSARSPSVIFQYPGAIQFLLLTVACTAALAADLSGGDAAGLDDWLYALTLACDLRYWNVAYPLLLHAGRAAADSRGANGPKVVRTLSRCAAALESALGDQATTVLQASYRQSLSYASHTAVDIGDLLLALDLAKGHRFSRACSGRASPAEQDATSTVLPELGQVRAPDLDGLSEDELWIRDLRQETSVHVPYHEDLELSRWDSQVYELPKRRLDAQVYAAAFAGGTDDPSALADLPSLVDPLELVLDLYLGATSQAEYALFIHACSRAGWAAATQPLPSAVLRRMDKDEAQFARPLTAREIDLVNQLAGTSRDREDVVVKAGDQVPLPFAEYLTDLVHGALLSPSGPHEAISELRDMLDSATAALLGPALGILRKHLAQGGNRVTIIPHGPLRTFPFHLLLLDGQPLAQHCAVTYAPTMRSLTIPGEPTGRLGMSAFSYAAGDPGAGFPALPDVIAEAAEIANMFGTKARQDRATTAAAFLSALEKSRYVHIATHGGIDEVPSFHHLVTAPDQAGRKPGRLYAFQILDRDLRGVELVTLSACTTSLVRFDVADNPRGMVANLLLRGAQFVVGAQWAVRTEVAHQFFVSMYQGISSGMSVPEAFWAAQRSTRERYPALRDWGAFALLGSRSAKPVTP